MSITPEFIVEFSSPIHLAPVGENEYSVSEFMAVKQDDKVRGFLQVDKFDGGSGDFSQHAYEIADSDNFDGLRGKTNNARIALLSESHLNGFAENGIREKDLKVITNPGDKDGFKTTVEGIINRNAFTQAASHETAGVAAPVATPGTFTVGLGKLGAG